MTIAETISLIASIASLSLAIIAIWLAIVFYKLSDQASKSTTDAAKGISSSVERLEKLFDKLYSDTFSMMKDTVTDMRKHIWRDPSVTEDTQSIFADTLKEEIESRVKEVLAAEGISSKDKQEDLSRQIESVVEKALKEKREAKSVTSQSRIRNTLRKQSPIKVRELAAALNADLPDIVGDLFDMRKKNIVVWDGDEGMLHDENAVSLASQERP